MKKITIIVVLFLTTGNIFSGWTLVNNMSNTQFYSLYFLNNNTGYVGGNQSGVIFKTTDGGMYFSSVSSGVNAWFIDIFFIDLQTGFACGQNGYVVKTTNAGTNWTFNYQALNFMHSIRFVNQNTGYMAGYTYVYKTTNAGNSWVNLNVPYSAYLLGTHFINANTGFICGTSGLISKTTNGGTNWQTVYSNSSDQFEEIVFSNSVTGYVAGGYGRIMKSTNAGLNWTNQISHTGNWLADLFMFNNNTGWACGSNGTIVHTSTGGIIWGPQYVPSISFIRQIHFFTPDTGYAVTDNGLLLKTTNAGVTKINNISSEIPNQFSLYQNYPNPFNPITRIKFDLPNNNLVTLNVCDINGKAVSTLINEPLKSGKYEIEFNASNLSSGIYIYQLLVGNFKDIKKMILIK